MLVGCQLRLHFKPKLRSELDSASSETVNNGACFQKQDSLSRIFKIIISRILVTKQPEPRTLALLVITLY